MKNGRCKNHGGRSTGPRSPEGLRRSRMARWKTGEYSRHARLHSAYITELGRLVRIAQGERDYPALYASIDRIEAIQSDPAFEGF